MVIVAFDSLLQRVGAWLTVSLTVGVTSDTVLCNGQCNGQALRGRDVVSDDGAIDDGWPIGTSGGPDSMGSPWSVYVASGDGNACNDRVDVCGVIVRKTACICEVGNGI